MNETNEREQDAAEIVAEWRAELEIHDREAQDGDRTWHFTHYIRADPERFIRAALGEIDRLTSERDAARRDLNASFELVITDLMASYDPEQIVHHVATLRQERDASRDKINAIVAWAESCDESANNPDVDADVAHDRKESVRDIYRLLGLESEAPE